MSETPPEQPAGSSGSTRVSMGMPHIASGARMPVPGNAEFALLAFIEIVFIIIWISAESVDTRMWTILTTVLVAFYFLSRGIAKASRVLEQ
jgi:hypothetical protein